ncbi:MAG: D-alanyl-D-alanine carboxypeptidase, partial [Actinobacteria bacterium]|nr:D-alanyl-D-alanine carboxypeptidase [Actinomycetota bacterium]
MVALLGVALALFLAVVAPARADSPAPVAPKASILVDADTGAVLDGVNVHEPLPPASLSKLITALAVVDALAPHSTLTVSARAAGMPAHNLNMKAGQVWVLEDAIGSLLVSSANDAAMALAEKVSGTAERFSTALMSTATRLGISDTPTLQDPAGLDDEFSVGGGNRISAYDLAIAARAVLAEPRLASVVSTRVLSFTGPDGVAHRLGNHNRLLRTYDGAVGMKTGYTRKSLHSLVAAATRNGRTMIAVILDAPGDTYGLAGTLLDKGFSTPAAAASRGVRLPPVPVVHPAVQGLATPARGAAPGEVAAATIVTAPGAKNDSWLGTVLAFALKLLLGFA